MTIFFVTNADGSDKHKLSVINKLEQPLCFKAAGVNEGNIPVYYYYNKTAWMQVGIWFNFLRKFNDQMRVDQRHVILISENAPTHPNPASPPGSYQGPVPPVLTNVRMVYIDRKLTPYLQPLDAGIISAFKACYRRKYASSLLSRHNTNPEVMKDWKVNVLEAIELSVKAWDEIPANVIFNCWQKTGIHPQMDRPVIWSYDQFLHDLQKATQISVARLLDSDAAQASVEEVTNEYLLYDEDSTTISAESHTIEMAVHVKECIDAGLTSRAGLSNDLEYVHDEHIPDHLPLPSISSTTAISYLQELGRFFQSLPITTLPVVPGSAEINISDLAKSLAGAERALRQYVEAHDGENPA